MASTNTNPSVEATPLATQQQAPAQPIPTEPLPQHDELEADHDSTYGSVNGVSETSTLSSSIVRGYIENGRRYQTLREGKEQYFVPADEKQFESIQAGHLAFIILESQQTNPLFRSPIDNKKVQNILDLGTGDGAWAIDVADRYPHATVRGVDLYPPPQDWVPPNCILEVDDITKDWTFSTKFDLIHIRQLLGSFSFVEWDKLYKRVYDNLEPGGWIEQLEQKVVVACDDGSVPEDAPILHGHKAIIPAGEASGNPVTVYEEMKSRIEKAGFINVHEKDLKMPYGPWAKHPVYKDVGSCNKIHYLAGLEGWSMWLLTKFGKPKPWSVEQVHLYLAELRADMNNPSYHLYQKCKRVWAQKPYDMQPQQKVQPVVGKITTA